MTRNLLLASGVLIAVVVILYLFVFRPSPTPLAVLADTAERVCLSNVDSSRTATVQSQLDAVKGIHASASAGTVDHAARGAVASLSEALKAEQDDKIRACMQPFIAKMIAIAG